MESGQIRPFSAKLIARQMRLVAALLSEPTTADAAKLVGVSERTARRWLALSHVKAALAQAQDAAIADAARRLAGAMGKAVDALVALAGDELTLGSARVAACRAILSEGRRLAELVSLTERVEKLELERRANDGGDDVGKANCEAGGVIECRPGCGADVANDR